jgi:hypothetical protein
MHPIKADHRIETIYFTRDSLVVGLMDGRTISVPLSWYPKLLEASHIQRANWKICGGGYGIHFPDIDEDLSTEGLLRGAPAPNSNQKKPSKKREMKSKTSSQKRKLKKRVNVKK